MQIISKKRNRMVSLFLLIGLCFLSAMGSSNMNLIPGREKQEFSHEKPNIAVLPFMGDINCSSANATFTGETGWDQAGLWTVELGDINRDGFDDFLISAYNYSTGALMRGRVYLFYGYPGAFQGAYNVSQANATFTGESANDEAGQSLAAVGDVNNDGYNDFLIGAPQYGPNNNGIVYLFYGNGSNNALRGFYSVTQANATFVGETANDLAGNTLTGVGDVNKDGFDDFIIGASQYGVTDKGRAYLFYGKGNDDLYLGTYNVNQANATFTGEFGWDFASYRISGANDVNGDGYDDFLIGSYNYSVGAISRGKAYLFYGSSDPYQGDYSVSQANATFLGEGANDRAGISLAGIKDMNGDGYSDFLVGADEYLTGNGKAYLFYGNGTPNPLYGNYNLASANVTFIGEALYDDAATVGGAGDVNKDGYADFLIGADMYGANQIGRAYLFYGNSTSAFLNGTNSLARANATFTGEATNDFSGWSVAIIGDVDNDGFDDIITTSRFYGAQDYGRCYLFKGRGDIPIIDSSISLSYELGTINNNITLTITDPTTYNPSFTVIKNGSIWGTSTQPWTSGVPFDINVDGLDSGDHNFTILANDGFGVKTSQQIIVTVFIINTNGTWQPVSLGAQSIVCKVSPNTFAELLVQGLATGAQIKITTSTSNPTSTALPDAVRFFSIVYDGSDQIPFPVTAQFYYNKSGLPSNVEESSLAVYHLMNGQWVMISRNVKANYGLISASCPSFSEYAIAVAPPDSSLPIDPVLMTWIIALLAIAAVSLGCIYKMKKGGKSGTAATLPELDFNS